MSRKVAGIKGALKVWWIPQITGARFEVGVPDLASAKLLIEVLAAYDLFQYRNNIKGDYANAGGLMVFRDGDWDDWENEHGESIDDTTINELRRIDENAR